MDSDGFLTFQKFSNKEDALLLRERLEREGIETVLEDVSAAVDVTFSGNTHENEFLLRVRESDFEQADAVLEKQAESIVDQFSEDHYLYEFSDDELLEVIEKSDEWSREDYLLAVRILNKRGHGLDAKKIDEIRASRLRKLRTPEKGKPLWIFIGYAAAVAGGLLGLLIGWAHWKSVKIDPTGKRFYIYDEATQRSGRNIFWIGVVFTTVFVVRFFWTL